jgi:tRNA modification GTPase
MTTDTIFALSSGQPPAGIAVVRISGPDAGAALTALAGRLPEPRRASYRRLTDPVSGGVLDEALILWFPGPKTATGEDLAELHLHGGRAVVAAVLASLSQVNGLRPAEAGEFTRRAFENDRIDLAQAEGLADLLAAETESQRAAAIMLAEGALGEHINIWQKSLLRISAQIEAQLDFSDEGDVDEAVDLTPLHALSTSISQLLDNPPAERLRDGVRIVLAGPPNAGKSSLFNALVGRDAAIVTDIAGTTRDQIEAPVQMDGLPLVFIDTAGLHEGAIDPVERIGIDRTSAAINTADMILWLGDAAETPEGAILIASKSDLGGAKPGLAVSPQTGAGMAALRQAILTHARTLLPKPGSLALNQRHREILAEVLQALHQASLAQDLLITAEHLRIARSRLDHITGRASVEDMLDTLFGGFCIGK